MLLGQPSERSMSLPTDAPTVRVTAGADSVGRKSWNLKRPVTIIGAQRRSHIVIRGPEVSRSHCVIVNTGNEVYLKDLHTEGGTRCNGRLIDLVRLAQGDVVNVGNTRIEVSITSTAPVRSLRQNAPNYAATRPQPPLLSLAAPDGRTWTFDDPVAVIGGQPESAVQMDEAGATGAHALIIQTTTGPAVCDLNTTWGTRVNGQPVLFARLRSGDVIEIGATRLEASVVTGFRPPPRRVRPEAASAPGPASAGRQQDRPPPPQRTTGPAPDESLISSSSERQAPPPPNSAPGAAAPHAGGSGAFARYPNPSGPGVPARYPVVIDEEEGTTSLDDIRVDLAALKCCMTDAWDQLNLSELCAPGAAQAADRGSPLESADRTSPPGIPAVEDALNLTQDGLLRLEAMLRGYLHDLTRCLEGLEHRERDLAAQSERIHAERLKLYQDQAKWARRRFPNQGNVDG